MIAGLSTTLPQTLTEGLSRNGIPAQVASQIGQTPPVASLFAAFLGYNPIQSLLAPFGVLNDPGVDKATLTGKEFFPQLISGPFHTGLVVVFTAAAIMTLVAAVASFVRGGRYVHVEDSVPAARPEAATVTSGERV